MFSYDKEYQSRGSKRDQKTLLLLDHSFGRLGENRHLKEGHGHQHLLPFGLYLLHIPGNPPGILFFQFSYSFMLKIQVAYLNVQPGQGFPQLNSRSLPIALGYPHLYNYRPGYGNELDNGKHPLSN